MTDPSSERQPERPSFWQRRIPGFRYVYSGAGIVGGLVFVALFLTSPGSDHSWVLVVGLAILALGVVSIPVYRWMNKRGW